MCWHEFVPLKFGVHLPQWKEMSNIDKSSLVLESTLACSVVCGTGRWWLFGPNVKPQIPIWSTNLSNYEQVKFKSSSYGEQNIFITNTGIAQFVYYYTEPNCFTKTKWYNITCIYSVVNIPSQSVHKVFTSCHTYCIKNSTQASTLLTILHNIK